MSVFRSCDTVLSFPHQTAAMLKNLLLHSCFLHPSAEAQGLSKYSTTDSVEGNLCYLGCFHIEADLECLCDCFMLLQTSKKSNSGYASIKAAKTTNCSSSLLQCSLTNYLSLCLQILTRFSIALLLLKGKNQVMEKEVT